MRNSYHPIIKIVVLSLYCLLCGSCSPRLRVSYVRQYEYVRQIEECAATYPRFQEKEDYFLVVHVDARHLDYSSPEAFFASMRWGVFLPQEPTIGHAWINLVGKINGKPWRFEGGHTGEFGLTAPRYFDEVVRRSVETSDPNPAKYLFSSLPDGCLQKGSGGHIPTLSVAFPLTEEQFLHLYSFLQSYDFSHWSLRDHQCVDFVLSCLALVGVPLTCTQTIQIPHDFMWEGKRIRLWSDKRYEKLVFTTPEALEKALFAKVLKKEAFLASSS